MPKYQRSKYSLKQYGQYTVSDSGSQYLKLGNFRRARISLKLKSGHTVWVYQHTPIVIKQEVNTLRIKSSTGDTIYGRSMQIEGNVPVRIKSNISTSKDDTIYSESITIEGGN